MPRGEHSIDETDGNGFSVLKQVLERDNYKVALGIAEARARPKPASSSILARRPRPAMWRSRKIAPRW